MARKCCVLHCEEVVREARAKGLPFHKFPKDPALRSRWLTSGGFPPDFRPTPGQIVCHRHFRKSDYEVVKGHKFLLKRGTVPTVFADYDNHPDPMSKLVQKRTSYPQEDLDLINLKILNLSESSVKSEGSKHENASISNLKSESSTNPLNIKSDGISQVGSRVLSEKEVQLSSAVENFIIAVNEEILDNEGNIMNPLTPQLDMIGSYIKAGECTKSYSLKEELENVQLNQDTKNDKSSDLKPKVINRGGINFIVGEKLEAKDFNDKWFPARIVETDWIEQEVLIHFDKWSSRFDEWIPMDSSRLRALQVQPSEQTWVLPSPDTRMREFVVDEKILATWADGRKYPAKVKSVLGNDRYDVLFDDGYSKVVKSAKMTKVAESSIKNTVTGEHCLGTKQERREKKRKHNVIDLFQPKRKLKNEAEKLSKKDEMAVTIDDAKEDLKTELDSSILGTIGDNSMDVLRGFENSTPPRNRAYAKKSKKEVKNDVECDDTVPEWVNGEPVGIESYIVEGTDGPRRSIIVPDKKLPPEWQKHFTQRKAGSSAGKWDVLFIHKTTGKKFRSRNDIRAFMESQGQFTFDPDMFDFCIHRKKSNKNSKAKQEAEGTKKIKTILPKTKSVTSTPEPSFPIAASSPIHYSMDTPIRPTEDSAVFIGGLRVEMEDSAYKCPKEGCNKNFRKENLLQMHIKHYHPEYSKFLGSTPNVADLAYARTIGESIDDIIPKKTNNLLDKINKTDKRKSGVHDKAQLPLMQNSSTSQSMPAYTTPPHESDDRGHQYLPLSGDDSKADSKSPHLSNGINVEEYNGVKRESSCAMSPGTLFDMRAKDEKSQTGIKTLLPVRTPALAELQRPDRSKTYDESHHGEKGKSHRKRQLADNQATGDSVVKNKRRQFDIGEDYGEFDDNTLDAEGPTGLMYRYSRRKSDTRSDDNSQNSQLNESSLEKSDALKGNTIKRDHSDEKEGELEMVMINGEMVKVEKLRREEIINCTCGIMEEDGLMIQCDLCLCWQHGHCNGIEKEIDVPEKYTCYTCQHSYRQRPSQKYIHDQEWLKEGKLPSLPNRTKNQLLNNQRKAMLKRSADLVAALLGIQEVLHCLRVKINVVQKKDHPKLYLWAKHWEKTEIPKPDVEPIPVMEIVKAPVDCGDTESEASHAVDNKLMDLDLSKALKEEVDGKSITSAKELMKILEEDNSTHSDESKVACKSEDSENQNEGHILLEALTKSSCSDDLNLQDSETFSKIENELSNQSAPTPSADQSLSEPILSQAEPEAPFPMQPFIPEPEAPIDPEECKLRLLDHIEHFQNHIEGRLTTIEAQINVLEDMDPDLMPGPDLHSKTKKTIQMLLRDLSTVRKLASLC